MEKQEEKRRNRTINSFGGQCVHVSICVLCFVWLCRHSICVDLLRYVLAVIFPECCWWLNTDSTGYEREAVSCWRRFERGLINDENIQKTSRKHNWDVIMQQSAAFP